MHRPIGPMFTSILKQPSDVEQRHNRLEDDNTFPAHAAVNVPTCSVRVGKNVSFGGASRRENLQNMASSSEFPAVLIQGPAARPVVLHHTTFPGRHAAAGNIIADDRRSSGVVAEARAKVGPVAEHRRKVQFGAVGKDSSLSSLGLPTPPLRQNSAVSSSKSTTQPDTTHPASKQSSRPSGGGGSVKGGGGLKMGGTLMTHTFPRGHDGVFEAMERDSVAREKAQSATAFGAVSGAVQASAPTNLISGSSGGRGMFKMGGMAAELEKSAGGRTPVRRIVSTGRIGERDGGQQPQKRQQSISEMGPKQAAMARAAIYSLA